jgi:hypothetical protein
MNCSNNTSEEICGGVCANSVYSGTPAYLMTVYCPEPNWEISGLYINETWPYYYQARVVNNTGFSCNITVGLLDSDGSTVDPAGTVSGKLLVDFGDGTAVTAITVSSATSTQWFQANHSYIEDSTFTITVTFTSSQGISNSTKFILDSYPGKSSFKCVHYLFDLIQWWVNYINTKAV